MTATTPTPLPARRPTIRVEVSASLTAGNHVLVEVNANRVTLMQTGPNVGKGQTIEILIGDATVKDIDIAFWKKEAQDAQEAAKLLGDSLQLVIKHNKEERERAIAAEERVAALEARLEAIATDSARGEGSSPIKPTAAEILNVSNPYQEAQSY